MRQISKVDEAKLIGEYLLEIVNETYETLSAATKERDDFAIGFLQYVENTYTKQGDQYYMKYHGLTHVNRNIVEVMGNYKFYLEQNEKQGKEA